MRSLILILCLSVLKQIFGYRKLKVVTDSYGVKRCPECFSDDNWLSFDKETKEFSCGNCGCKSSIM